MKKLGSIIVFCAACAPSVEEPSTIETDSFSVSYPSNWSADKTADGGVFVEERLFLGQIVGATFIRITPHLIVESKMEHTRTVRAEVAGEVREGVVAFDWTEEEPFIETYCFGPETNTFCVETGSDKQSIERARPGIDLILESLAPKSLDG